jgi:hypothetical protein
LKHLLKEQFHRGLGREGVTLMADKKTVHNPPAGGDQAQASTNDDNVNDDLADKPFVVAISDGDTVGVFGRFADRAAAEASAKAAKANRPQKRIEVRVVKENDITDGLPAFVAEVEGAKIAADEDDTTTETRTSASSRSSASTSK